MSGSLGTAITVLGGVGLFLLGMTVMTDGLKALAGSSLRTALGKAAATPLSGAFWGAIVTLLVQSSSAVTMTTIGLVSAGLLTFPQGLGLVFGANVGTTGTGWLVALIGVRVSLSTYALPMIFVGALVKLLGGGRIAAAGASLAGFALVLYGLTTLQQGMGGLAERLHPSDLPSVLGMAEVGWAQGSLGLIALILDRRDRGDAHGFLRRRDRARTGRGPHHRAEYRDGDQLGARRHRREHDREAARARLCAVQGDRRRDRPCGLSVHRGVDAAPRAERRRRDPARRLSHRLQCCRRRGSPARDPMVHPLRRTAAAREGIAARPNARPRRAGQSGGRDRGGPARRRRSARYDYGHDRRLAIGNGRKAWSGRGGAGGGARGGARIPVRSQGRAAD